MRAIAYIRRCTIGWKGPANAFTCEALIPFGQKAASHIHIGLFQRIRARNRRPFTKRSCAYIEMFASENISYSSYVRAKISDTTKSPPNKGSGIRSSPR